MAADDQLLAPRVRCGGSCIGFAMIGFVVIYGVAGYMAMGWTFMDAFYQVFITISAVGLTEVHPLVSTPLRLHTMLIIAMGLFSVAFTLGGFISFLTEGEFYKFLGQQHMLKQIETLERHHDRGRVRPGRGPGLRGPGGC